MPNRTPATIISSVLTSLLLILFAVLSILTQMRVLNGASERLGMMAMSIALIC